MSVASAGGLVRWGGLFRVGVWLGMLATAAQMSAETFTVLNTNDTGSGSFRQTILDANATPGTNRIEFRIPGAGPFTISPASAYPPISPNPAVIDATTQEGYSGRPLVEINGSSLAANTDGIYILAGSSTVRGLAINRCKRDGIRLEGAGGNLIQGNYLGTGAYGTNALANGLGGITINRSSNNQIGGTNSEDANIISGNNSSGVFILGPATNNCVQGNLIGLSALGLALGNKTNGIAISGSQNLVGGPIPEARNIISGNGQSGIYFLAGGDRNLIQGNFIGTDSAGNAAIGNRTDGITVNGGASNVIGGTNSGAGNLISGNNSRGILISGAKSTNNLVCGNLIGLDISGRLALANKTNGVFVSMAPYNIIGGIMLEERNVISGNGQSGLVIAGSGASNNLILGNLIGVDASGTNALPNQGSGIVLSATARNRVGGSDRGARNVISGNTQAGVLLGDAGAGTNLVQGNFIGTDITGTRAIGNNYDGVWIEAPGNVIGGDELDAGNLISGNRLAGIYVFSSAASNNVIQGNFIGTDLTGSASLGNSSAGILISNAPGTQIGGTTPSMRNLVSANVDSGVRIGGANAKRTVLQGNFIGTDRTGRRALGNLGGGVYIYGSPSNTLGGSIPGSGNLISGNYKVGISIGDPGANFNVIQGNWVGLQSDGVSPLGNEWHNLEILNSSSGNLIGGSTSLEDNHIAFARSSSYDGIRIRDGCTNNFISRNSVFSNGSSTTGLGIDISTNGLTTNNLPTLSAALVAQSTAIKGQIHSAANKKVLLQFYVNSATNISGYGEGYAWLGSHSLITDTKGNAAFSVAFPPVSPGQFITATATPTNATTSEFSRAIRVESIPAITLASQSGWVTSTNGQGVPESVYVQNSSLSWQTTAFDLTLFESTDLTPPVLWTPVTNSSSTGGTFQVTLPTTNGACRFFQLRVQ